MTTIYFVRHAEPNFHTHDDAARELTAKGLQDRKLVTAFLSDKNVDLILSSPYKRAVETIADLAEKQNRPIITVPDFRERKVGSVWIDDFDTFCRKQWTDFDYKLSEGETLNDVQRRNIAALNDVLRAYPDRTIAVGSHGTALSTIINYYDHSFGFADFTRIKSLMPWVVKFTFDGHSCIEIKEFNLFE